MRAIYNGVDLGILETHYFNWESVYDDTGTDYLYSKVSFACRALVNGYASVRSFSNSGFINYGFGGSSASLGTSTATTARSGAPFVPGPIPASVGVIDEAPTSRLREIVRDPPAPGGPNPTNLSHQAVRYRLSIPRRPFYVFWDAGTPAVVNVARLFLESPVKGFTVDCKNGPTPRILSVVEALGDANTLMVDWACETYINEAELNDVRQVRALVSNRFSQSHSVAENGYTSITTEGVAVFRTDKVFESGSSPDDARAILFMPIPRGFTREILYCRGRADVTGVEYGYRDTQVPVNFVAGPYAKAANISVVHQQTITTNTDVFGTALETYERVLSIAANRRFAKPDPEPPPARPVPAAPKPRGARSVGTPPSVKIRGQGARIRGAAKPTP